jgi:hypothetical protein
MKEDLFKYIIYINEKKTDFMKEILKSDLIYSDNIYIKNIITDIFNFNINININSNNIKEQIQYVDNKTLELNNNMIIIKNNHTNSIYSEKELITLLRKKKINNII